MIKTQLIRYYHWPNFCESGRGNTYSVWLSKNTLPGDQSEAEERTIFQVINALKAIDDVVEFAMLKKL